jgi:hypothetical protein
MNKLNLIIEALEGVSVSACQPHKNVIEALAAARELRDMKPVAWYAKDNLEINDEVEIIWNSEKPTYAEVWIPLYELGESNEP